MTRWLALLMLVCAPTLALAEDEKAVLRKKLLGDG
jgi:hypothetical protein